jgi:hypothetical protein
MLEADLGSQTCRAFVARTPRSNCVSALLMHNRLTNVRFVSPTGIRPPAQRLAPETAQRRAATLGPTHQPPLQAVALQFFPFCLPACAFADSDYPPVLRFVCSAIFGSYLSSVDERPPHKRTPELTSFRASERPFEDHILEAGLGTQTCRASGARTPRPNSASAPPCTRWAFVSASTSRFRSHLQPLALSLQPLLLSKVGRRSP